VDSGVDIVGKGVGNSRVAVGYSIGMICVRIGGTFVGSRNGVAVVEMEGFVTVL
jgi:hypothetical protein